MQSKNIKKRELIMSWLDKYEKRKVQTMQFESDEIEHFRDDIEAGKFPPECLKCYEAGLKYCIYWNRDFTCDKVEKKKLETQLKDEIESEILLPVNIKEIL